MRARVLGLALALAVTAAAPATAATIKVTPTTVKVDHKVRVHGRAAGCHGTLTLLSFAFPNKHEFAGVPAIYVQVGAGGRYSRRVKIPAAPIKGGYEITGRCGGGNLGVSARVIVRL